jgi:beta-lactamase class A
MASTVKVPIGLELYARADDGVLDASTPVTIEAKDKTPGPVGISQLRDPVTVSLRDASYLMLTISDNAATDAVAAAVGIEAVNRRLRAIGCLETVVLEPLRAMLDGVAADLGFATYDQLVAAQRGDLGPAARSRALDRDRIDRCRALDPAHSSRTTARDATRLLAAIWNDSAAGKDACAELRSVMAQQLTRRLGAAVPAGGTLAAKSGALFGRVRNEIAVVTDADGEHYAVGVFTRAHEPFVGSATIDAAMAAAAKAAVDELRG